MSTKKPLIIIAITNTVLYDTNCMVLQLRVQKYKALLPRQLSFKCHSSFKYYLIARKSPPDISAAANSPSKEQPSTNRWMPRVASTAALINFNRGHNSRNLQHGQGEGLQLILISMLYADSRHALNPQSSCAGRHRSH